MLQQTQVSSVIPYYKNFLKQFPSLKKLADAPVDAVLACWSGLGYYARARNLHKAAAIIRQDYRGRFPVNIDTLESLPGIGRSTAGAILALSKQSRHPILDGNVKRVLCRYYTVVGWSGESKVTEKLWHYAEINTPDNNIRQYTQAIMDLGATVCTRSQPQCSLCPFRSECGAYRNGQVTRYPYAKPKKILPIKQTQMLMLEDKQKNVLLLKRPDSGIWGGLWSFPECGLDDDVIDWCQQHLGLQVEHTVTLAEFKHTFSHYQLQITPVRLRVSAYPNRVMEVAEAIWYNKNDSRAIGYATPIKRLLALL